MKDRKLIAKAILDIILASNTQFFSSEGNHDELKEIAEKRGISLPSPDFALFKTIYAEIDKPNRNKVVLRKDSVEDGLPSIVGKQINFDHKGKSHVCGWILDAYLEEDKIVLIGLLFKSLFKEEMENIKTLFAKKKLFVSFEIHAYNKDGEFVGKDLGDGVTEVQEVHFAGCGLLINEQPACPNAEVLELMASLKGKTEKKEEVKSELIYAELAQEFKPEEGRSKVMSKKEKVEAKENKELEAQTEDLEAKTVSTTKEDSEVTKTTDYTDKGVEETVEVKATSEETVEYESGVKETVKNEVNQTVTYTYEDMKAMEEKLEKASSEADKLKAKVTELEQALEAKKYTEEDLAAKVEEAKQYAVKVTARRIAVGDEKNEIDEADLADDVKFENLQLKAEIETLKSKKFSAKEEKEKLVAGGSAEDSKVNKVPAITRAIDKLAWS